MQALVKWQKPYAPHAAQDQELYCKMTKSIRFVHSSFCDDIRHEQGNKISLMGIYQSSILIPAGAPRLLTKICVVIEAQTSIDDPFKSLVLQLRKDDQVVEELTFPDSALSDFQNQVDAKPDFKIAKLGSIFILQNYPIEKPCRFSVVAITEREEFLSARLNVEFADDLEPGTSPVG